MTVPVPTDRRSAQTRPILLAIETAGSGCSVAIACGRDVLAAERRAMRHGHPEALLPMIARVTEACGLPPSQIEVVAAATGPGGFTGIRVGLAAAHGIALALGAKLVGVTSFAAVAAGLAPFGDSDRRAVLVALDSRRADLYVQPFAIDRTAPLAAPAAILPADLPGYVASVLADAALLIAGDAAMAAAAALGGRSGVAIAAHSAPDALGVAAAALHHLRTDGAAEPVRPLYLRPPDVTLPKRREPGAVPGQ